MKRTHSFGKRFIALLLSLVLILSLVPGTGLIGSASADSVDSGIISGVADSSTMDSWKTAFDPANISTEHAGGVWTDKSVIKWDNVSSAFGNIAGLEAGENNFLVALSALAANSVVTGKGAMPTDTVLVLDISGSMSTSNLRAMVSAANDAIHTLLTGNEKNRVGVVLYASSASVLLPLDRYTPVTDDGVTEYIEYSNSRIRAARVQTSGDNNQGGSGNNQGGPGNNQNNYTYTTNSSGTSVTTSVSVGGGTYIQGGLWKAWEQFSAASVTDERTPVLVLMSDGAPTFVSNDYNSVPDDYESGDGNSSGDGEGFLTQLTAAYVKEKIAAKYSTNTYTAKSYMYTLGLGLSTSETTPSVAEAVLNTSKTRSGMNTYWTTFLGLASKQTKTMDVSVYEDSWWGSSTEDVTVTYDATLNSADQKAYVDKYFPASGASDLSAAFKSIVNEISLKSSYYVSRLDGQDANMGGYVTFVDEIGTGMEVKEIEGILIGDTLYTGQKLAQAMENGEFGSVESPTSLGDNLVWAVVERLRITASESQTAVEIARELLGKAYAAGQISYDSTTGQWSNYIAWFGDKDGKYIGFWDTSDPNAPIPEGAVYANACYGMLGTTTDEQTAHASDMMYVAIQVSKPVSTVNGELTILTNSPQTVTFRIPASLLPTVTYQINVELGSDGQIDEDTPATITYNAAEPIRLVYEVGVHSELTPENISQFVREGYQAKDDNGNYYLYTNAWNWEGADDSDWQDEANHPEKGDAVLQDTGKNAITYSYFEPGEDNEHYYFTEDSLVYSDTNGTLYTGSTQPSGTMYFKHLIYTATANSSDPSAEVKATITAHYEELSAAALEKTEQTAGASTWYVPEGTMHRNMHDHDSNKAPNATGSFFAIRHQLVDIKVNGDASHHHEIIYLGNNGRITYAPAQGVDLTKVMAEGESAEGQSFSFTVEVSADADGKITVTRNGVSSAVSLTANKAELALAAGETVRITGMDIGETYTITENVPDGYSLSGIMAANGVAVNNAAGTATGTVQSNVIHAVTYTNTVMDYGSLLISKAVTYLKGSQPDAANAAVFPVTVTLNGMGGETVYVDGTAVTLASDGTYTFNIVDGQNVLLSGIPAGTSYTVEEARANLADGYSAVDYYFNGTIQADTTAAAALKNQYEPEDIVFNNVEPKITVEVNKTMDGTALSDWSFDFVLKHYDGAWEEVKVNNQVVGVTATMANPKVTFDLSGITLDTAGEHYFRVEEVIPSEQTPGMTYDRTFHDFKITVVDDLSGQLKIQNVTSVQHAQVSDPTDPNGDGKNMLWNITTSFTNKFSADSTKLTIQANKTLFNTTTGVEKKMTLKDGQFQFTLYTADANFENLVKKEDSKNGLTGQIIFLPITYEYTENGPENTYYYVVKETGTIETGYTADDTVYKIAVTVAQKSSTGDNNANTSWLEITKVTVQKDNEEAVDVTAAVAANGNILNGDAITFKNTYKATTAQVQISGEKTLSNETPGAADKTMTVPTGAFSFKLTALDGAPLGNGSTSETVTNNGAQFAFSKITFNEAGTYHYTITEEAPSAPGMSKDPAVHAVTVVVTDNGAGVLTAAVAYNGEAVNGTTVQTGFHNTYKAEPVTGVEIKGHKDLIVPSGLNRTLKAGEFHFTLAGEGITETVSNAANGDFVFSALRFDTIGTYEYTITETNAGAVKNGVTYDTASYQVTVTVTDNDADGKLEAAVEYQKVTATGTESASQANFQNTYAAASVTVQLTAHKYLTGDRDLKAGEFSFTLTKPNGTETVTNAADGQVNFSAITYYGVGEHSYKIVENKLDDNGNPLQPNEDGLIVYKGVTYSLREYTVTVNIIDNGSGNLVAHVTTVDDHGNELPAQFFNRYEAHSVTVNIEGDKANTEGKTLTDKSGNSSQKTLADFDFRFVLTDEAGNVIETVSDDDVGGFSFADVTFDKATEIVYYIYEQNDSAMGVTYDSARYKVTVKVTDDGEGQLEADVSYEKITEQEDGSQTSEKVDGITFSNVFEPDAASMQIVGDKTLTNVTPGVTDKNMDVPAGKFLFKLTALDGAPMADGNTSGYEIVTTNAGGRFAFSAIRYTQPGTFRYMVTEEDSTYPGVTKDSTVYYVTVVVVQKLSGKMEISITCNGEAVDGNVVETEFNNTYLAAPVTGIVLKGSKELIVDGKLDRKLNAGDFNFVLTMPDGSTKTVTNDADGNFSFTILNFNAVGSYTFQIAEEYAGTTKDGVTYDGKVFTVVVDVTDDGNGKLVARINGLKVTSYELGVFRNTYSADPVTVNLTGENDRDGEKVLEDKTSLVDKNLKDYEFKFVLTDAEGNAIETVSDNDSGFNFADITYSEPTEEIYYIYEVNEGAPAVAYDSARYQVTVKVTDGLKGKLVADVSYEKITNDGNGNEVTENADEVKFTNIYEADPTTVLINGTKTLSNETPGVTDKTMAVPAGKFFFKLTAVNGAPMAAGNTTGYETVTNGADGRFGFSVIEFTQEGTYKYTITEENIAEGTLPGVRKDATVHTLSVVVTDNDGKLTAAITYDGEAVNGNTVETAFHNTYVAAPVTGIEFSGSKELLVDEKLDHPMKAGDFSFILTMPDGSKKTVSNDANGKFVFPAMSFNTVGTYTFTIAEENGGAKKDGITYDDTVITVVLQVEDNGKGQLVAKIDGKEISGYNVGTFRNTYTVESVTVNLTGENDKDGSKTLTDKTSLVDKTLNDFAFKFVLTDGNGNEIETVTENGSGFNFTDITYSEPTQKVYFIYELDENVPGVIYDTAKYKVVVKVTDNGKGQLVAEVSYEKITTDANGKEVIGKAEEIAFANTYEAKATSVSFSGIKTFNGGRKLKAGEFSFILKDATGKEIETVQNDADGKFTFTAISYTKEGKHVYTLEEVKGEDSQVTYDGSKFTLTVTVADVDGELKTSTQITVNEEAAASYGFTNLFTPENAKAIITVEKVLENKSDKAMGLNGFQFDLTCVETGKTISAISGKDGLAEIELSFTAADVGKTYTYKLTEHKGDVEGMTYSDTVYEIKIAVSQDAESGELVLTVTRDGKAVTENAKFVNTYNKVTPPEETTPEETKPEETTPEETNPGETTPEVTPPEEEIPKTGEELFVGNWAAMMSVSAICLLAVLVLGKKKFAEQ